MFGLQDSDDEDVEGEIDDQIEVRILFSKLKYCIWYFILKLIYSEKATNFCKISNWHYIEQIYGGDFTKFCGLLRLYEL